MTMTSFLDNLASRAYVCVQIVKKKKQTADNSELRGRFRTTSDEPKRIADRVKKAPLKS
jgi:hypothetical protein